MSLRRVAVALLLTLSGLAAGAACGESGVVGGECISGYIVCDGRCVDPSSDALNCGSCNNACPAEAVCRAGECEGGGATGGSAGEAGASAGGNGGSQAIGGSAGEPGMGGAMGLGGSSATGGGGGVGGSSSGVGGLNTGGVGGGATGTGGVNTGTGGTTATGGAGTGVGGATTSAGGSSTGGTTSTSTGGMGGVGGVPCLPPYNSPDQCGDCDTQCSGGTPLCAPASGGGFECVSDCDMGFTQCNGECVDLQADPQHCGRCDNICPSGVCVAGDCIGATAGHIVYICMDYEQVFQSSAQTTLLGNAVFLPRRDPVRVLAYSEHAESAIMNSTDRTIRWAGTNLNLTADITRTASLTQIESELTLVNYDVFLVYDQSQAASGQLAAAGAQLAATLDAFTSPGGVVVVMSGGTGIGEMPAFATSAGLANISAETPYTSELAYNRASFDVIGFGVISPFLTLASSCTLTTTEAPASDTVFVVTDTAPTMGVGAPVVLHKISAP